MKKLTCIKILQFTLLAVVCSQSVMAQKSEVEPTGDDVISLTACTGVWTNVLYSCTGDSQIHLSSGETVFNNSIYPMVDGVVNLGSPVRRFREINGISGYSTMWSASTIVHTPNLDLGLDSLGNSRIITANNSIIQNDYLNGGTY